MIEYFDINAMPSDKALHFKHGFLYSFLGILWWPFYILGFMAGVVKEMWDSMGHGDAEWADMLFTFRGAALGAALAFSLRVFFLWYLSVGLFKPLVHIPILHRYL